MKTDIHEYAEDMGVEIELLDPKYGEQYKNVISEATYKAHLDKRLVITALNEGGCNCTQVDLIDTLKHVKENMRYIWDSI